MKLNRPNLGSAVFQVLLLLQARKRKAKTVGGVEPFSYKCVNKICIEIFVIRMPEKFQFLAAPEHVDIHLDSAYSWFFFMSF